MYSTLHGIIRVRKYRPIFAHVISSDNSRWEKFRNVGVNSSVQGFKYGIIRFLKILCRWPKDLAVQSIRQQKRMRSMVAELCS